MSGLEGEYSSHDRMGSLRCSRSYHPWDFCPLPHYSHGSDRLMDIHVYTFASCISMCVDFSGLYIKVTHVEFIQQLHVSQDRIHILSTAEIL